MIVELLCTFLDVVNNINRRGKPVNSIPPSVTVYYANFYMIFCCLMTWISCGTKQLRLYLEQGE